MYTHIHDEKVQPAPVVCEIFPEAVSDPLQSHFQDEDVGEDFICVFKDHFHHFPLFNVDVFKRLSRDTEKPILTKHDFSIIVTSFVGLFFGAGF